jgi:uncharacterized protein
MPNVTLKPWYREPWPWILMAAPAAAVIAGTATLWLAVRSFDGLVADDYYKQGLALNQVFARAEKAKALGIEGALVLAAGADGGISASLHARSGELPRVLNLSLTHPTRVGLDQRVTLLAAKAGDYAARIGALAPGRWHVIVEDPARQWRLRGELQIPQDSRAELSPGR